MPADCAVVGSWPFALKRAKTCVPLMPSASERSLLANAATYASVCGASMRTHADNVAPRSGIRRSEAVDGAPIEVVPENFTPAPISDAGLASAVNVPELFPNAVLSVAAGVAAEVIHQHLIGIVRSRRVGARGRFGVAVVQEDLFSRRAARQARHLHPHEREVAGRVVALDVKLQRRLVIAGNESADPSRPAWCPRNSRSCPDAGGSAPARRPDCR